MSGPMNGSSAARRGQAAHALLFWVGGAIVFFSPFLRSRQGMDPEGDDPGRLESEIDLPFEEDVSYFEEDYELELGSHVDTASREYFGAPGLDESFHSETLGTLDESGLFETPRLEPGRRAYQSYCVGCHGLTGDGAGAAARHLEPRPRNFRRGIFKFTGTSNGVPPRRRDLYQTITRGLSGSSMPEFRLLSEETRWDLAEYVRYLAVRGAFEQLMVDLAWNEEELPDAEEAYEIISERWASSNLKAVYPPSSETEPTPEAIERGRHLFVSTDGAYCAACHGESGKGDGPSAGEFRDDWGYPIVPRDLTTGVFRAGGEPADLYRSIATGINGTPMPAYGTSISPEDTWALVHFIRSLAE